MQLTREILEVPRHSVARSVFQWLIAFFVLGGIGCTEPAAEKSFLEIKWIALPDQAKLKDENAGRELRLRIPREYVTATFADQAGEGVRIKGVDNGGIEIVRMRATLPDLTPPSFDKNDKRAAPSMKLTKDPQIGVDLDSSVRRGPGAARIREQQLFSAKKKRAYRLPDLYDLQRYRRVGCSADAAVTDVRFDLPLEILPDGCRVPPGDEVLINVDSDGGTWITCGYSGETMCVMRTYFQGFWALSVIFPKSELAKWKEVRDAATRLINKFSMQ